jgi:FkbM family methyltransferase
MSLRTFRLPNGLSVFGLSKDDTIMIYKDIFEDDCYRQHGVTIEDGDCILDVGANTGLFVLFLNQICATAQVYAFEPVPATFEVLKKNAATHNKLDLQLFNVGLSDKAGEATFSYYPRMSNASTMFPDDSEAAVVRGQDYVLERFRTLPYPVPVLLRALPQGGRRFAERVRQFYLKELEVTCELRTLSDVIRECKIGPIDLLKIDAEQSETNILAGLTDDDWPKIRQVIVEVHYGTAATRAIVEQLRLRGFRTAVDPNPAFPTLSLVFAVRENEMGVDERRRQTKSNPPPLEAASF